VVRDTPESMGLRLDNAKTPETHDDDAPVKEVGYTLKQAGRTRSYWLVIVASLASPAIGTAILFHLQPLLIERGIGPADAESVEAGAKVVSANAKTLWALVMIAASLPAGWLCDRLAPRWVFAAGLASLGLTCGMLYAATSPGLVYLSILPFGVCNALLFTIVPTATARFFGRTHHGEIRGAVGRWVIFATAAGPALMSLPQEVTGDFSLSLLLFAASTVPGVALALLIRPPGPVAEADSG
jgi:MFS family permease